MRGAWRGGGAGGGLPAALPGYPAVGHAASVPGRCACQCAASFTPPAPHTTPEGMLSASTKAGGGPSGGGASMPPIDTGDADDPPATQEAARARREANVAALVGGHLATSRRPLLRALSVAGAEATLRASFKSPHPTAPSVSQARGAEGVSGLLRGVGGGGPTVVEGGRSGLWSAAHHADPLCPPLNLSSPKALKRKLLKRHHFVPWGSNSPMPIHKRPASLPDVLGAGLEASATRGGAPGGQRPRRGGVWPQTTPSPATLPSDPAGRHRSSPRRASYPVGGPPRRPVRLRGR